MRKLVLIKHAMVDLSSEIPSNKWILSANGKWQARKLAGLLDSYTYNTIFCSHEPKAIETAQLVAEEQSRKVNVNVQEGIHEHERTGNRVIYPKAEWHELLKTFFAQPDQNIFGDETANEAKHRFTASLRKLISTHQHDEDLIVVTHGTVMSLFIAAYNDVDVFQLWESLGLPSYAELNISDFKLNTIININ